ncbi:MAG: AraC family transcriptional regulator [Acidobacteria bacterium]|nr:AraC family transcriptional regulator [Acidobacteriota bacterium]MCB9397886.1 AraC family transcriptional regulator [Acidobacteriota bacterium]
MVEMEAQDIRHAITRLAQQIAQSTQTQEMLVTAVPGLSLFRRDEPSEPTIGMYEPSICMVAQGAKRVQLGSDTFVYNARTYLITAVHLPTVVQVTEASPQKPYLGLKLKLDTREIAQLMADTQLPPPKGPKSHRGMATAEMTLPLLHAFVRLLDLQQSTADIPILSNVIQKEIFYRLLVGEQGARLRQIALAGTQSQQISRAIDWLKTHYAKPLRIEELAAMANMGTSTFHHHFRTVTALSPLQYQKQLRLQEARRLMLAERLDAASAAFEVGYESPSQFSREYARQFGAPPLRDINQLRTGPEIRGSAEGYDQASA